MVYSQEVFTVCTARLVFAFVVCARLLAVEERRWAPTRFVGAWFRGFCGCRRVRETGGVGGGPCQVFWVGFGGVLGVDVAKCRAVGAACHRRHSLRGGLRPRLRIGGFLNPRALLGSL